MAGLDPAIQETRLQKGLRSLLRGHHIVRHRVKLGALAGARVGGRVKPGHDGEVRMSGRINHSNWA
jgi:hypothetical protein